MNQDKTSRWVEFRFRLRRAGVAVVIWLAGRVVALLLIVATTAVTLSLLYGTLWRPLKQTVGLPPTIAETKPEINTELLGRIRDWQQLVGQRSPQIFPTADQVIVATQRPAGQ